MGNISVEKANNLYWLGRYTERVFTTLSNYFKAFDSMLDGERSYSEFCVQIGIPDIYGTQENFLKRYIGDTEDSNSIISNLYRAYDNAIVLRDEISTETLSYIHMALDCIKANRKGETLYYLQEVLDDLYAFWGCADDCVEDEECRNLMKCGKYVERLDLYIRTEQPYDLIEKEYCKLENRLRKVRIPCNESAHIELQGMVANKENWSKQNRQALSALSALLIM